MNFGGNKYWVGLGAILVSALIGVGVTVSASNAVTPGINVCVNAKTNALVLAKSGKCKPGYRKLLFGSPTSNSIPSPLPAPTVTVTASPATTAVVSNLSVFDSNGNRLGPVTAAASFGEWSFMVDGYILTAYPETGIIRDNGVAGYFATSACNGQPYWPLDTWDRANRFRASDPLVLNYTPPGTTRRTGTVQLMVQDLTAAALPNTTPEMWVLSYSGDCVRTIEFSPAGGTDIPTLLWVPMREVYRVHDFNGPLSIR